MVSSRYNYFRICEVGLNWKGKGTSVGRKMLEGSIDRYSFEKNWKIVETKNRVPVILLFFVERSLWNYCNKQLVDQFERSGLIYWFNLLCPI